jgi:thymidylate synthase
MENKLVPYKPYNQRSNDFQYEFLLTEILNKGKKKTSLHSSLSENKNSGHKYCLEIPCRILSYDLTNGVPITPVRDLGNMWKGAIGEIVAFINGARTLEDLVKYGCPEVFWKSWVTKEKCAVWGLPEGDLGTGSYGQTLTSIPTSDGKTFNQILALERQMARNPLGRTNLISTWYTPLAMGDSEQNSPRNVVVAPCHGNMVQFDVMDDLSMHMTVYQRSADTPIGLVLNLTEWIAFGMMVAYIANTKFVHYSHVLPNPQIYDIQIPDVKEMLNRTAKKLPSLYLRPNKDIKHLIDFRKEDFYLEDYYPHPKMKIPALI